MINRTGKYLGAFVAAALGFVAGVYAQSQSASSLAKLYQEKAEISKMDLVLVNTRIGVLQEMLKEDLSVPYAPTSISYDGDEQKIRVAVFVDPAVPTKMNRSQLASTLEKRAIGLCIETKMADGNLPYMLVVPKDFCAVRFFTHTLDASGHIQPTDVAVFDSGKLTMK